MTVDQLFGMAANHSFGYISVCFIAWLLGIVTHFIKKCYKENLCFKDYWLANVETSIGTIVSGLISFFTILVYSPSPDIVVLFSAGYITDSVINKPGKYRSNHERVY